jgi:hypothetical protein
MMVDSIYLGPLGRLMQIQMPSGGFSSHLMENGSNHTPLSGRRTKDIFSRRFEYDISLDGLSPGVLSWLELLYTDAITGPFYLLDSSRVNRLRARISSTGTAPISHNVNSLDWTISSGVVTFPAATVVLLPAATGHLSPGPSKAAQWVPTAAGTLLDTAQIPVIPGETITFSCYAQAGAPTLEIVPLSASLVAGAPITGTVVVGGTPPRRYVTYTVPTNGSVVAVQVQLRASAAGTYTTTAWQLEANATPGDWALGTGVPKVLFDDMTGDRQSVGTYTASELSLLEV